MFVISVIRTFSFTPDDVLITGFLYTSVLKGIYAVCICYLCFRFEEDSSSTVARFPRIVLSSVRREDTRRRDQRNTLNERKEREKIQEREEMKRLKNLKKMEIQDKIELIKKVVYYN